MEEISKQVIKYVRLGVNIIIHQSNNAMYTSLPHQKEWHFWTTLFFRVCPLLLVALIAGSAVYDLVSMSCHAMSLSSNLFFSPRHIFCYFSLKIYLKLKNVMPIVTKFVPQYLSLVMQNADIIFNKEVVRNQLTVAKALFQERLLCYPFSSTLFIKNRRKQNKFNKHVNTRTAAPYNAAWAIFWKLSKAQSAFEVRLIKRHLKNYLYRIFRGHSREFLHFTFFILWPSSRGPGRYFII